MIFGPHLYIIGIIGAAFLALFLSYRSSLIATGVEKERASVSAEGEKKNVAAKKARARVTADNSHGVLDRFWRD